MNAAWAPFPAPSEEPQAIPTSRKAYHADPEAYRGVRVQLEAFDGPLDLLLHLIERDEIDIYDIPIARITRQYLEHIELMKILDLEVAGEYLVMAATLIRIKSQMLLPRPVLDEEGEEIDPRDELVRRLLAYRKFKDVAAELRVREEERSKRHVRGVLLDDLPAEEIPLGDVKVFDLLEYFRELATRAAAVTYHEVEIEPVSLEERMLQLQTQLATDGRFYFADFVREAKSQIDVIVGFLALLEVMKLGEAFAFQDRVFGPILVVRRQYRGIETDA